MHFWHTCFASDIHLSQVSHFLYYSPWQILNTQMVTNKILQVFCLLNFIIINNNYSYNSSENDNLKEHNISHEVFSLI